MTVCDDVSQPVAVRPDGIVASTDEIHELFGACCDYTCEQVRRRTRRSKPIGAAKRCSTRSPSPLTIWRPSGDGTQPLTQLGVLHSPIVDAVRGWLIVIQDPDGNRIRLYTLEFHGPEVKPATDSPWLAG